MKSYLFQRLDFSESGRMREDMAALFALKPETLSAFVRRLPILQMTRRRSMDEAIEQLGLDFPAVQVPSILSVLLFFGRHAASTEPSEDWVHDMVELGFVDAERRQRCVEIIDLVRAEFSTEENKLWQIRQYAEDGVLPRFVNAAMTVELRAMFEKEFSHRGATGSDYSPKLMGVVPILTLQVELDSGASDRFQMQFTHEDLRDFITILEAAEKQLEVVKNASQSLNKVKEA